jgi:hypothetical protein
MLQATQVSLVDGNDSMHLANIYTTRRDFPHADTVHMVCATRAHDVPAIIYWESSSSSSSSSSSPSSGVGVGRAGNPTLREGLADRDGTGTAEREGRGNGVGRIEMTKERLTDGRLFQKLARSRRHNMVLTESAKGWEPGHG